jgi:hypothetical protein
MLLNPTVPRNEWDEMDPEWYLKGFLGVETYCVEIASIHVSKIVQDSYVS